MRRAWLGFFVAALALAIAQGGTTACGGSTPPAKPCDQTCADGTAVRGVREMLGLAFNLLLQGKDVGAQDSMVQPCPLGGTIHITGTATSNAKQGATFVDLTYVFDHCGYEHKDSNVARTYHLTLTGTVKESGTIAVQPSSTTALSITSDSLTLAGTVYDPPIDFNESACKVALGQQGNNVAGSMCARDVGVSFGGG